MYEALGRFGAPMNDVTLDDLARPGIVIQLGVAPNRIDIVTSIDGVSWQQAWQGRVDSVYGDAAIHVIGRAEFIQNKRACGRPQDLADVAKLEGAT